MWFKHITEKINVMTHLKCFTSIQRVPKDAGFRVGSAVNYNISLIADSSLSHGGNISAYINSMDSTWIVQTRLMTTIEKKNDKYFCCF